MKHRLFFTVLTTLVVLLIVAMLWVTPAFASVDASAKMILMLFMAVASITSNEIKR